MKKALAFNKEKFNREELEEMTAVELMDLWCDNFCDVALYGKEEDCQNVVFYDNEADWQEAMNNGEFADKIVMFIESDDCL